MDVSEIMRLAGANEDAETFQVALEGAPRPGSQLALRPAASAERRALAEKRGYAMPLPYNPNADRVYARMCVALNALGEVNNVVGDLWKCLDRLRFGEDPDSGFSEAATKIQEGPLADIERLVKGAGFALDQSFDRRAEQETSVPYGGMVKLVRGGGLGLSDLDTGCLHLRGEVAEALAILKIVAPEIDKATLRDLPEIDADLWKKAAPAFLKGIEGRVDVLCAAVEKLIEKRTGSRSGTIADALDRQQLAHGAALAEALGAQPPEQPNWRTGFGEATERAAGLKLDLPLRSGYDKNDVYAFVQGLNAKLAKDKRLSAGATSKYDATQVTDIDFSKSSVMLWFVMAPGVPADAAHAKLLAQVLADAVLTFDNAESLFQWDGDAQRPDKDTYRASALQLDVVESALGGIGESVAAMVGKAFAQRFGDDEIWVLGTQALKHKALKVSVVKAYADQGGRSESATTASFTLADLMQYQPVALKDVPKPVALQWKAAGALQEASKNLAALRVEATEYVVKLKALPGSGPMSPDDMRRYGERNQGRLITADSEEDAKSKFAAKMRLNPTFIDAELATAKSKSAALPLDADNRNFKLSLSPFVKADRRAMNRLKKDFGANFEKTVTVGAPTPEVARAILAPVYGIAPSDLFVGKTEHAPAMEGARAVFVARFSIPARKPATADASWADEEEKMASDFELALERSPIKSAKASKAQIKVTKIGFEGSGAKYALKVTMEISGEGVSSEDADLITALDKRGEAALDAVVMHGEQAADVAFGDTDWKRAILEVM